MNARLVKRLLCAELAIELSERRPPARYRDRDADRYGHAVDDLVDEMVRRAGLPPTARNPVLEGQLSIYDLLDDGGGQ